MPFFTNTTDPAQARDTKNSLVLPADVAPTITIISPANTSYLSTSISLVFTLNETTAWIGYSLDGQANTTIAGNTTLPSLLDGTHRVTVYANDTTGSMTSSGTVYFTIDTVPPTVQIVSPENKTYVSVAIWLRFVTNEPISWVAYSLNGQANRTINGNTTIAGLDYGTYSLILYVRDVAGNTGVSNTVYFTKSPPPDVFPPSITIMSPKNRTYNVHQVSLNFTVTEQTSWMAYALDDQANTTITGDIFLPLLTDGAHRMTVYAQDMSSNTGRSPTITFTIDTIHPVITVLSPKNETYTTSPITISFTVSEQTTWTHYSLDHQTNITTTGNTTLGNLPDGPHSLILYANDTAGNIGASETIYFTINTQQLPPIPWPLVIGATIIIVAAVAIIIKIRRRPVKQ